MSLGSNKKLPSIGSGPFDAYSYFEVSFAATYAWCDLRAWLRGTKSLPWYNATPSMLLETQDGR